MRHVCAWCGWQLEGHAFDTGGGMMLPRGITVIPVVPQP